MQFQMPNQIQQKPKRHLMTFKQFLASEQAKSERSLKLRRSAETETKDRLSKTAKR
jgi:hypothetical protein